MKKDSELNKRHGIISILDILGTKNMWEKKQVEQIMTKMENFYKQIDLFSATLNNAYQGKCGTYSIQTPNKKIQEQINKTNLIEESREIKLDVSTFSDTIIFSFHAHRSLNDRVLLGLFGFFMILIFNYAFVNKIYLRGVVNIGDFYLLKNDKRSLIMGPAINEAANLYETTNWIGISTTPSASLTFEQTEKNIDKIIQLDPIFSSNGEQSNLNELLNIIKYCFIPYDIPNKNGIEKDGLALAWPIFCPQYKEISKIIKKNLDYKRFQKNSIGHDIFVKFKNTRDFYNALTKKSLTKKI